VGLDAKPKFVTFDMNETLIKFSINDTMREVLGDRLPAEVADEERRCPLAPRWRQLDTYRRLSHQGSTAPSRHSSRPEMPAEGGCGSRLRDTSPSIVRCGVGGVRPLLPESLRGRKRLDDRTILKGIACWLWGRAAWRDVSERYGTWATLHTRFRRWPRRARSPGCVRPHRRGGSGRRHRLAGAGRLHHHPCPPVRRWRPERGAGHAAAHARSWSRAVPPMTAPGSPG
jgi:hypothetical protein